MPKKEEFGKKDGEETRKKMRGKIPNASQYGLHHLWCDREKIVHESLQEQFILKSPKTSQHKP